MTPCLSHRLMVTSGPGLVGEEWGAGWSQVIRGNPFQFIPSSEPSFKSRHDASTRFTFLLLFFFRYALRVGVCLSPLQGLQLYCFTGPAPHPPCSGCRDGLLCRLMDGEHMAKFHNMACAAWLNHFNCDRVVQRPALLRRDVWPEC